MNVNIGCFFPLYFALLDLHCDQVQIKMMQIRRRLNSATFRTASCDTGTFSQTAANQLESLEFYSPGNHFFLFSCPVCPDPVDKYLEETSVRYISPKGAHSKDAVPQKRTGESFSVLILSLIIILLFFLMTS